MLPRFTLKIVPRPLPDLIPITSAVTVADTRVVRDVEVKLTITHAYVSDLAIVLIGPNGVRVELSLRNGGSGDNYVDTIFDDEAAQSITTGSAPFTGRFRPQQPLAVLDGIPANGTWTLEITDMSPPDVGTLDAWSLSLTTGPDLICSVCQVLAPTGEVQDLRFAAGPKTQAEWSPTPNASFYNVYRGVPPDLPSLLSSSLDSCRRMTAPSTSTGDTLMESSSTGAFFWYLVRARNACGAGRYGSRSDGSPRSSAACP